VLFKRKPLSIAIIGGCQAEGLKVSTQALLPRANVSAWHVGVNPPDAPDVILKKLKGFDWVFTQITSGPGLETLQFENLQRELNRVHFIPTVVFSGFHPDVTYIFAPDRLISAVHSDFHSKLAVAGFLLGLSPRRTSELYNAVVFAELGYFDVFEASRIAMEDMLRESGFDISGMVEGWLREIGSFMYMINHPNVALLAALCRDTYVRVGLLPAGSQVPKIAKDHLAESFTWPLYPSLAKRLGLKGSWNFQRPAWLVAQGARDLPLGQYLEDLFAFYGTLDREHLEVSDVLEVRDKIASLVMSLA